MYMIKSFIFAFTRYPKLSTTLINLYFYKIYTKCHHRRLRNYAKIAFVKLHKDFCPISVFLPYSSTLSLFCKLSPHTLFLLFFFSKSYITNHTLFCNTVLHFSAIYSISILYNFHIFTIIVYTSIFYITLFCHITKKGPFCNIQVSFQNKINFIVKSLKKNKHSSSDNKVLHSNPYYLCNISQVRVTFASSGLHFVSMNDTNLFQCCVKVVLKRTVRNLNLLHIIRSTSCR